MRRRRDTIFYFHALLGARVGSTKSVMLDHALPTRKAIHIVANLTLINEWTVDDYANDRGGWVCELSLKQVMAMDEADE